MVDDFVHLHCHSEFSLLDGLGRVPDLVDSAAAAGMPALALTDHGTMFGAIEFYSMAKERGIKPILGCEVYVADRPLDQKPGVGAQNFHLVLLAESEAGYRNLIKLTTEAHVRGFYRKPRVDRSLLEGHAEGLICLSACASGELAEHILRDDLTGAEAVADWYRQVFDGRYYLELQYHDLEFQPKINQGVVHVSQRLGLPLVATNDVHYVRRPQSRTHEILLCIQTQTTLADTKRMKLGTEEFYLKSASEMRSLFANFPDALANTLAVAERCNLELTFGRPQLPHVETPGGESAEAYLRSLCEEGLKRRYGTITQEIRTRADYELSVVVNTGFVDYFLLVYDVISFARGQGIPVGPGRGSAAGSLLAYALFLTNVDPLAYGLSFERFLNPERVSMPDMDLDFADDRREEVIQYVTEKYGRDRVAQIITFGTLGPKAGVRDVGRCLGMSYPDVDRVAKLIPQMCSKVAKAKEESPDLQQLYDADPAVQRLLDTVEDLEGVARHASTHAAGVVISRDPLTEHVPLYKVPKSGQVTTQYAMSSIEKIGLLKMDFLGLRTLTVLERAREFVKQTSGVDLDLDAIPLDDPRIYELLSSGETFGVFQVDGSGMRRLLKDLRPTKFSQLVALEALYRPGPMEHIDEFVRRKTGVREVKYDHPAMEEELEETYGIVVYQDQVMRLAVRVAGYTMGEADLLRRAMAKKKPEELAKHRETFIQRAGARGTDAATAERLFDIIEPFAGYAFNKAHAAAYAVITCQTAYLKAVYPTEYLASLLSAERDNADKVAEAMAECRRLGIQVLGPDVNRSSLDFTLENNRIRFGLSAVKHVGTGVIESLLRARQEGGPFTSLENLSLRLDWRSVNKRALESLARCGALDTLGVERRRVVESLDRIVSFGANMQRASAAGQQSLFGEVEEQHEMLQLVVADPATLDEKLEWEQELLGTYVSPHPLTAAQDQLDAAGALPVGETTPEHHGQRIRVGGVIRGPRTFSTKDGRPMGSFQLTDLRASLEVLVFSRRFSELQGRIVPNALVVVEGKFDAQEGRVRLLCDQIYTLDEIDTLQPLVTVNGNQKAKASTNGDARPVSSSGSRLPAWRLTIELCRGADRSNDIARILELYEALQQFKGDDLVELVIRQGTRTRTIPLPDPHVEFCDRLQTRLTGLLPDGSWRAERLTGSAEAPAGQR